MSQYIFLVSGFFLLHYDNSHDGLLPACIFTLMYIISLWFLPFMSERGNVEIWHRFTHFVVIWLFVCVMACLIASIKKMYFVSNIERYLTFSYLQIYLYGAHAPTWPPNHPSNQFCGPMDGAPTPASPRHTGCCSRVLSRHSLLWPHQAKMWVEDC